MPVRRRGQSWRRSVYLSANLHRRKRSVLQSIHRPGRGWTDWTRHAPRERGFAKPSTPRRTQGPVLRQDLPSFCSPAPRGGRPGAGEVRFFVPDDPNGCAGLESEGTRRPLLVRFSPRDAIWEYMRTYLRLGAFPGPTARLEAPFSPDLWRCLSVVRSSQSPTVTHKHTTYRVGDDEWSSVHHLHGCVTRRPFRVLVPETDSLL